LGRDTCYGKRGRWVEINRRKDGTKEGKTGGGGSKKMEKRRTERKGDRD
jgi:hypothetical protein